MRLAPEALARGLTAAVIACCLAIACSREARDVRVTWNVEPTPAITGAATRVRFTLQHDDGSAVRGAKLQLQAHMAHPGMAPVVSEVSERGAGAYHASLLLSMAGDWVFVVTGELADGRRITREIRVPAVRPAG